MSPADARVRAATAIAVPVTPEERDACQAVDVLRRVGDKWSMLVLYLLSQRSYGFNELDRAVHGLSRRILTRTLRQLEQDGLVSRTVHAGAAARVEYALTELGGSLLPLVQAVGQRAVDHAAELTAAHPDRTTT